VESYEDNPATNILAAGVTEEKLNAAIIKSGYPLQTKVALLLQDTFRCHNECCVKVRSKKIWKPGLVNTTLLVSPRTKSFDLYGFNEP